MQSIKRKQGIGDDPAFQKAAALEVASLLSVFAKHGLCAFADYGTLLGIVRDQCFMSWDDDADVSVLAPPKIFNPAIIPVLTELKRRGFRIASSQSRPLPLRPSDVVRSGRFVAIRNTVPIDVFLWVQDKTPGQWKRIRYLAEDHQHQKGLELHNRWIGRLTTKEVHGVSLPCPADSEALLEHRYGPNWKEPLKYNGS